LLKEAYLLNHAPSYDTRRMGKRKLAQVSPECDENPNTLKRIIVEVLYGF